MKQINFTEKRKLPYLLDLKKGDEFQVIMPAWKHPNSWAGMMASAGTRMLDIPPEHSKDDIVEYGWDLENDNRFFCMKCGLPSKLTIYTTKKRTYAECCGFSMFKNRHLGKIKITEWNNLEIGKDEKSKLPYWIAFTHHGLLTKFDTKLSHGEIYYDDECESLAKRDSFKSAEEFFKYYEKYDLSSPKKFYVYRGVVI